MKASQLQDIIGEDAMEELKERYGGQIVRIPLGPCKHHVQIHEEHEANMAAGMQLRDSIRQLAQKWQMAPRTVRKITLRYR